MFDSSFQHSIHSNQGKISTENKLYVAINDFNHSGPGGQTSPPPHFQNSSQKIFHVDFFWLRFWDLKS